jgi:hypothetical protein
MKLVMLIYQGTTPRAASRRVTLKVIVGTVSR